jgi:hypothetical protein
MNFIKKLICFTAMLFLINNAHSQDKKTILQLGVNGVTSLGNSVYQNGFGLNATYLWPLSPSFNLGPEASYYRVFDKAGNNSINPLSLRLNVMFFPGSSLQKASGKPSVFLSGLYFEVGIGHNFNTANGLDDAPFNCVNWSLGYLLPKSSTYVKLGINNFILNSSFLDDQRNKSRLFTATFGVSMTHHQTK